LWVTNTKSDVTPKEYDDICDEFEAKYVDNNNNGVEVSM